MATERRGEVGNSFVIGKEHWTRVVESKTRSGAPLTWNEKRKVNKAIRKQDYKPTSGTDHCCCT